MIMISVTMAWSRLSATARAAWLEFSRLYNGRNNGRLIMSERMLIDRLGKSPKSKNVASRAIKELVTFGFLLRTRNATFSSKRIAAELTHLPDDRTQPPAQDFSEYRQRRWAKDCEERFR
jgi:hypothetical protein